MRYKRLSISFSISYVRVCEYAENPHLYQRPKEKMLKQAEEYATAINDQYIIDKISEIRAHSEKVESTPTPKLPKPTKTANKISESRYHYLNNDDFAKEINLPLHEDMFTNNQYLVVSETARRDSSIEKLLKKLDMECGLD